MLLSAAGFAKDALLVWDAVLKGRHFTAVFKVNTNAL